MVALVKVGVVSDEDDVEDFDVSADVGAADDDGFVAASDKVDVDSDGSSEEDGVIRVSVVKIVEVVVVSVSLVDVEETVDFAVDAVEDFVVDNVGISETVVFNVDETLVDVVGVLVVDCIDVSGKVDGTTVEFVVSTDKSIVDLISQSHATIGICEGCNTLLCIVRQEMVLSSLK